MPGRSLSLSNYRFGFNGKEDDNEAKGLGNWQDYGLRIYDPRLGKFASVDPLARDYPWNATYSFAEDSPIKYIDLDGGEKKVPETAKTETIIRVTTEYKVTVGIQLSAASSTTGGFNLIPLRFTLFKAKLIEETNTTTGRVSKEYEYDYPTNGQGTEMENSASLNLKVFEVKAKQTIRVDSDMEYICGSAKKEVTGSTPSLKVGDNKTQYKTTISTDSKTGTTTTTSYAETSGSISALVGFDYSVKTEIITKPAATTPTPIVKPTPTSK